MGLGPGIFPYGDEKPTQLVWRSSSYVVKYFPVSGSMCSIEMTLRHALNSQYFKLHRVGVGVFCFSARRVYGGHLHQLPGGQGGGPAGHRRPTYTIGADLAVSSLSKSIVPFSAWPIMFSLVTPITECSGRKSLDFYSWWLAGINLAILRIVEVLPSIVMGVWCFTYNGKSNLSLFCLFDEFFHQL